MSDDISANEVNTRLSAMETAMGLMIDTMQLQSNLLREIADAVRQEPGELPIVTALDELTQAVVQMGANVEILAQRFEVLPDELASALNGRGGRINSAERRGHRLMLTYRTGLAGRQMAEHLLQQTLPPEMAIMAEYYEQGVTPPTTADAAASRYARLTTDGLLPIGETLDTLVQSEAARIAESALNPDGTAVAEPELAINVLAAFAGSRHGETR